MKRSIAFLGILLLVSMGCTVKKYAGKTEPVSIPEIPTMTVTSLPIPIIAKQGVPKTPYPWKKKYKKGVIKKNVTPAIRPLVQSIVQSPPNVKKTSKYRVIKGDCLWDIAKKPEIYGDPWKWPQIYRDNSDIISDPNLIYVNQKLTITKTLSEAQSSAAKQEAELYGERK